MTPDLFSPAIVLDTSILNNSSVSAAPFQVMKKLIEAGLTRVYVPELAIEEFRTQWRDKNQSNITQGIKSMKALAGETLLPDYITQNTKQLSESLTKLDLEELSKKFLDNYMANNGFLILPLTFEQARDAWRRYFVGNLPSKKIKHRSDIPDAHIVAALNEMSAKEAHVLFVTADKGQRESADENETVICFDSLDALIKSVQLTPLIAKWETEQNWQTLQATLPFEEVADRVTAFVLYTGGSLISWEEVHDSQIPEDNHSATITAYGEPDEIEIEGPEDWGVGILRYRATYFSESLLSFSVFKSDAFDVPEWVSVTLGDFEKDHYFDAEGYAQVIANVDVTVRIRLNAEFEDIDELIEDICFEQGSLELSLAQFN